MRPPDVDICNGYLHRWYIWPWKRRGDRLSVYLHWIRQPDPGRHMHDHPSWSITIVLRGWYAERFMGGFDRYNGPLSIRYRPAWEAHTIEDVAPGGCWTIWIRGRLYRKWGFWLTDDHWVEWDEYEALQGRIAGANATDSQEGA